jgi:bifunctional DNA-binding transcriptional regulator/antitoxin component of YhaV-PrlF toxin-antitoxin module
MTTVLNASGWLEIPQAYREADSLKVGQECEIERVGQGEYHVRVIAPSATGERLIDVLQSCPVKDWWTEPDRTERTSLEPSSLFAE